MGKPLQKSAKPTLTGIPAAVQAAEAILLKKGDRTQGKSALADVLNISRSAVSQWREIPVERCAEIETLLNVPKSVLRPDFF